MADALRSEGAAEGLTFAFDKIAKTPNTLDSHRLIRWAGGQGVQGDVVERLFSAYFLDGRDIGVLFDGPAPQGLAEGAWRHRTERGSLIEKGGWATMPGSKAADSGVPQACATLLSNLK